MKYLDPVALAKLGHLSLNLNRLSAEGRGSGRHRSLIRGFSHDFSQHRPYAPGDEVKTLDWKLYARQDRFFVREYNEETLLTATLLLDASGSMGFGGKWDHACRLAMALSYLVIASGDAAGLTTFDVEPRRAIPPRQALSHLESMDAALQETEPGRETDLGAVLEQAAPRIKRRSLLIVISDLLGDPEKILASLKTFKARKHELMVLQVLDPRELDLGLEGPVVFESLEDGALLSTDATALAESYKEELEKRLKLYETTFHRSDVAYALFLADRPWDMELGRLLSRTR